MRPLWCLCPLLPAILRLPHASSCSAVLRHLLNLLIWTSPILHWAATIALSQRPNNTFPLFYTWLWTSIHHPLHFLLSVRTSSLVITTTTSWPLHDSNTASVPINLNTVALPSLLITSGPCANKDHSSLHSKHHHHSGLPDLKSSKATNNFRLLLVRRRESFSL